MVSDSSQAVSIDTPNCKEAKCRITNSEGIYYVAETPATITVNKAFGDLTVICEKNGKSETSVHKSSANVATFGNILFGGIPGALIDGGTGSGYDYPTNIVNNLSCEKPSSNESKKNTSSGGNNNWEDAKIKCAELGFREKSEKYANCVLKLNAK